MTTATRLAPFPRLVGSEPCQDSANDPNLWSSNDSADRAAAQLLCRSGCPTREQCLAWAIDHPTESGDDIWAGTTKGRRVSLRRKFTRKDAT
jgi:hypothetical protein